MRNLRATSLLALAVALDFAVQTPALAQDAPAPAPAPAEDAAAEPAFSDDEIVVIAQTLRGSTTGHVDRVNGNPACHDVPPQRAAPW